MKQRVVFYSHDTFGLGHIRRTQKLANSIASAAHRSILIACASPKASSFASAPGIEYLNLPGFTKLETGDYIPRNLDLPVEEFARLRSELLLAAIRFMKPDVLIIDKEPLGVKKELLPALQHLRAENPSCRIVCGFRDILDEKSRIDNEWQRRGTYEALEEYFDHILIYGEKKYFDFAEAYDLPESLRKKLIYLGYVGTQEQKEPDSMNVFDPERPLVTFTMGGGGDGDNALELILATLAKQEKDPGFNAFILTGPFASRPMLHQAQALMKQHPWIHATDFVSNTADLFRQSAAVISMGGYNAMTELMALGKPLLILPRVEPRQEQLIRAQIFEGHGLCRYLHPNDWSPARLHEEIQGLLREPKERKHLETQGLVQFQKLFHPGGVLA